MRLSKSLSCPHYLKQPPFRARRFFCAESTDQANVFDDLFPNISDDHRSLVLNALEENSTEALTKVAESGVGCAMALLGMSYRDGIFGSAKDEKKAIQWLQRGVKNDDACSMYLLGEMRYDENTKAGAQEARLLWKRAAHHGHLRACYKYGVFLYAGLGGATNNIEARKLLEKASKGGLKQAWFHYSRLLSLGLGGPMNEEMSRYWAGKAMECKELLEELESDLQSATHMKALAS
jgi:TPR repeat protein